MRAFGAVATVFSLSLIPVSSLVFPAEFPDTALGGLPDPLHKDAAVPVLDEQTSPDDILASQLPLENDDDQILDLEDDPVALWLDRISTPEPGDGAVFTSTLFETFTSLTAAASSITSIPQIETTPLPSAFSSVTRQAQEPPQPTPSIPRPDIRRYGDEQKPLRGLGKAWASTKTKLKAFSQFICPLHSDGEHQQHSFVGSPSKFTHPQDQIESKDGASSVVVEDLPAATPLEPQPTFSIPPSKSALPTRAVTALAGAASISLGSVPPTITPQPAEACCGSTLSPHLKNKHVLAIVLSIIITVTTACIIFAVLARRNPRRRAERLAAWEECRNKRIYATATIKYRLRNWSSATFAKLLVFGSIFGRKAASIEAEKEGVTGMDSVSILDAGGDPLLQEVHSFRAATQQIEALINAEEGAVARAIGKRSRDRNQRRTYLWLFGGRRARRPRANSGSESDSSDAHSESEKSGMTPPPPYADREMYVKIPDFVAAKMAAEARDVSDKSSVSSLVPTSPKEGSMTLGSNDSDSEKEDV